MKACYQRRTSMRINSNKKKKREREREVIIKRGFNFTMYVSASFAQGALCVLSGRDSEQCPTQMTEQEIEPRRSHCIAKRFDYVVKTHRLVAPFSNCKNPN